MYLEIPEQHKSQIEFLVKTDDETIDAIISALSSLPSNAENVANVLYTITNKIIQAKKIDKHTAFNIASTLIALRQFYKEENLSNEDVVDLIGESIENDTEFLVETEQIERFKKRLSNLLEALENNASYLDISEKASDLLIEYERIFSDSRIITDIRPVFDSETEKKVEGAILIHTLKIQYKDAEATKEFYVALDSDDLDNLHEQVIIAVNNRNSLVNILKRAEIEYINPITEMGVLDNLDNKDEQRD